MFPKKTLFLLDLLQPKRRTSEVKTRRRQAYGFFMSVVFVFVFVSKRGRCSSFRRSTSRHKMLFVSYPRCFQPKNHCKERTKNVRFFITIFQRCTNVVQPVFLHERTRKQYSNSCQRQQQQQQQKSRFDQREEKEEKKNHLPF